ncbi:hypothetical protein BKA93DRAFT_805124 [Sparassis latifolia]
MFHSQDAPLGSTLAPPQRRKHASVGGLDFLRIACKSCNASQPGTGPLRVFSRLLSAGNASLRERRAVIALEK